jgi:hypothetical protein
MKCRHSWDEVGRFTKIDTISVNPEVPIWRRPRWQDIWNSDICVVRICTKCYESEIKVLGKSWEPLDNDKVLKMGEIVTQNTRLWSLWHVIMCDKFIDEWPPTLIEFRDDRKRLHNENGPSLEWPQYFKKYHWHGVSIPSDWIESPEEITSKEFISERNAERRRALYEILGRDKALRILNANLVDDKKNPDIYPKLYEVHDLALGTLKMVQVKEPTTGSIYTHFVNIRCKTAKEAVASLWSLSVRDFHPENLEV